MMVFIINQHYLSDKDKRCNKCGKVIILVLDETQSSLPAVRTIHATYDFNRSISCLPHNILFYLDHKCGIIILIYSKVTASKEKFEQELSPKGLNDVKYLSSRDQSLLNNIFIVCIYRAEDMYNISIIAYQSINNNKV